MWQEFTRQARALEQLLADKQLPPSDSQQAWDELQRMRGAMGQAQQQQAALQQMYEKQQDQHPPKQQQQQHRHSPPQQQQGPRVGGRRGAPQQQQQQLQLQLPQERSWLSQQHSTLCVSSQPLVLEQQQQQGCADELPGDSLEAFMVETQMVPVTVNGIPDSIDVGSSLMQLMIPPAVLAAGSSRLGQPVQHHNRYGGCGLDAELSACSVASAGLQARGSPASSSSAPWGGWQGNQQQQQQRASQRPPASPPILRGDRFVEAKPGKQLAGSSTTRAESQQQQQSSPTRKAGAANTHAGRAAARGGKASGGAAAGSAGKASNARRRI
ncbi:hypothetical protein COO60DRAFT_152509 [Scenedesmus sp. NREL 46B-D3]|nr:hypothetical protein COO60DRAFT_152509 [Scenedesmus sp. NREL 46B-D3]